MIPEKAKETPEEELSKCEVAANLITNGLLRMNDEDLECTVLCVLSSHTRFQN